MTFFLSVYLLRDNTFPGSASANCQVECFAADARLSRSRANKSFVHAIFIIFHVRVPRYAQSRGRRNHNLNDQFRWAVPTFVIAGITVVARHVGGGPATVRALAPDVRAMPILPSPRVTAFRHCGLVRCQIQQRLLLVVTREIILRPAPVGRAGRLSR